MLLSCLLAVINVLNFTMAADDADFLTEHIAQKHGVLNKNGNNSNPLPRPESSEEMSGEVSRTSTTNTAARTDTQINSDSGKNYKPFRFDNGRIGLMGPDSPEMNSSLRYFTYAFDKEGNIEAVDFRMSAVSEEEAKAWASSLLDGTTGWTNVTYRYRVYTDDHKTFVTVIDQSRELWPCYRILIISVIGGVILIVVSFLLSWLIGSKLFKPLEEADRKQKLFVAKLENEFKVPLTVINADTETLERQNGSNPQTQSINKQVKRMTRLVKDLGSLTVFEEPERKIRLNISDLLTAVLENSRQQFTDKKIALDYSIEPDITLYMSDETAAKLFRELLSNSLKFSVSKASFALQKHHDRIKLIQTNDTSLPDGSYDQIFDRFTVLENAAGTDGAGLGLSYVKDIVRSNDGRISAGVKDGIMTITIDL